MWSKVEPRIDPRARNRDAFDLRRAISVSQIGKIRQMVGRPIVNASQDCPAKNAPRRRKRRGREYKRGERGGEGDAGRGSKEENRRVEVSNSVYTQRLTNAIHDPRNQIAAFAPSQLRRTVVIP